MNRGKALLALFVLVTVALPVNAQDDPPPVPPLPSEDPEAYLAVELEFTQGAELFIPNYDERGTFRFVVHDISRDGEGAAGQPHNMEVKVTPVNNAEGWQYSNTGSAYQSRAGQSQEIRVSITPTATAVETDLRFAINVTLTGSYDGANVTQSGTFLARAPGTQFAFVRAASEISPNIKPDEIFEIKLDVKNPGLLDRSYAVSAEENTCDLRTTDATVHVPAGETKTVTITGVGPADKPLYRFESCALSFKAVDTSSNRPSSTVTFNVVVTGSYIDPGWIINLVIAAALIAGFVYLILILKRRAEEEVLGKPQPPWTLPAEQLYLQELEKKDPRAAYVVRHFLMEDEYQSSLMWYRAYKKATRGRRVMERRVLKMERSFERWDAKQQARLDRQDDTGDKGVDKLQAKLDKKSRKSFKKDHKKWRKQVSKLETKAANAHNKALGEYRKELKKATKKGLPEPARPVMDGPELPPEPEQEHVLLDEHKWASKKDKIYARAARDEEKAYERYDKERSKRLETMRKKMEKMADKIDDPTFVAEHPLLQDAIASSN